MISSVIISFSIWVELFSTQSLRRYQIKRRVKTRVSKLQLQTKFSRINKENQETIANTVRFGHFSMKNHTIGTFKKLFNLC